MMTRLNQWLREAIPWLSLRLIAYTASWFVAGLAGTLCGPLMGQVSLLVLGWVSSKAISKVEGR